MKEINSNNFSDSGKFKEISKPNDEIYKNSVIKKNSKIKIVKIVIISISICFIFALVISLYFLINRKNRLSTIENLSNPDNVNIISASYSVEKNKKIKIFNPSKISLSTSDYYIKLENQTKLRLLTNIDSKEGYIVSSIEGIIDLIIGIKKEIDILNGLFTGCSNLKKIDLSGLNACKVTNYDFIFQGCSSLEKITFPNNISENVNSMNNMFDGCQKIKEVNLSSFKISEKTSMSNVFSGCNNLQNIDISSFNNVNSDFFIGINSGVNVLTNKYLANEIRNQIKKINIEINIILDEYLQINSCQIGEESKCKKCGDIFKFLCIECNEGFYLYTDLLLRTTCKSCEIENCNKCNNIFNNIICLSCKEGYKLNFNKCIPKYREFIKECEKGENEKCLSCNNEKGKEEQCLTCNQGYYLPNNQINKTLCKKCEIDNCIDCNEDLNSNNIICNKCKNDYKLKNNKCLIIKPNCLVGQGSLCQSCRPEDERIDECLTCNDGYYIAYDEINNKSICNKCPIAYCKKCQIKDGKNICIECENNYNLKIDDKQNQICQICDIGLEEKCKSCGKKFGTCGSCNEGYILTKNDTCLKIDNSILVNYEITNKEESVRLFQYYFYSYYYIINKNDILFFENNVEINPTIERGYCCEKCGAWADYFAYKFDNIGNHTIKIVFKSQLKTMKMFFNGCYNITSIKFSPSFDTSQVDNMEGLFYFCENLVDLDISMFNTSNVVEMNFMFYGLYKIKSLDLSNFDTRKTVHMQLIFEDLHNLEYLDISSWDTSITTYCAWFFGNDNSINMAKNVTLKISNKFKYGKSSIPSTWKVINIDEL